MLQTTESPLMKLPAELRIMVYNEYIGTVGEGHVLSTHQLLWVSKQIQEEYAAMVLPELELAVYGWELRDPQTQQDDCYDSRSLDFSYPDEPMRNNSWAGWEWPRARDLGIDRLIGYLRSVTLVGNPGIRITFQWRTGTPKFQILRSPILDWDGDVVADEKGDRFQEYLEPRLFEWHTLATVDPSGWFGPFLDDMRAGFHEVMDGIAAEKEEDLREMRKAAHEARREIYLNTRRGGKKTRPSKKQRDRKKRNRFY